jgi:hypothetical protein
MVRHITYIIFIFLLFSCGSKSKSLTKNKEKTETKTDIQVDSTVQSEVIKVDTVQVNQIIKELTRSEQFTGEVSDPKTPASVEREVIGNKVVTTFKGFKNVKQSSKSTEKLDSIASSSNKIERENSIIEVNKSNQSETKTDKKQIIKSKEKEEGFPWWWLIAFIAVYFVFSDLLNSFNPLSWLKKE